MVDATKGLHAIATTFSILLISYLCWSFINGTLNQSDTFLKTLLWASWLLAVVVCAGITPWIIATSQEESDVTIASSLAGYGTYFLFALLYLLVHPLMTAFGGVITAAGTGITQTSLGNTAFWFLEIIYIVLGLIIVPTVVSLAPNMVAAATGIHYNKPSIGGG